VLGAVVAAAIALPLVLHPTVESQGLAFWAIYIDPVYRLLEFVAGICLCALLRDGVRLRVRPGAAALLAVAAYVVAGHVPLYAMWVAVTVVPFCILIFACAQADVTGYRGVLHHPWLIRLGQWSYAFYLVHTLVLRATAHANGIWASDAWRLLVVAASYGVTIVVAYALFRFVEHPLERRIRRGGTATPQSEVALAR
jgi:peptidoglycan/LPS O-acetylase OafA/YrhL